MTKKNRLTLEMTIFTLFIFAAFSIIIITENYRKPKIEEKLHAYLEENYQELITSTKTEQIEYKNKKYTMKVSSKANENLYFIITYKNKKITDTYKKDYYEGKTLLTHINNKIQKTITKKTNSIYKTNIPTTLDKFTSQVKSKIMAEKNLESLKIYNLEAELIIESWNQETISETIKKFIENLEKNEITPKTYTLIISDKTDITKAIKVNNLTNELIKSTSLNTIINDIINNKKSNILNNSNVTYEYLN